jgi:glycosyltransferase involved in cell wall biosynthesis
MRRNLTGIKLAAFGFRSVPPMEGSAGSDQFAADLYPRLVERGYRITAYNRRYSTAKNQDPLPRTHAGVNLVHFHTLARKGFDSLIHSFLSTLHIVFCNRADVVHIHNGGNSIWALFLRLTGKKVIVSQDGIDWKRDKWPWYGKLYLYFSALLTMTLPNAVVFDNIFVQQKFAHRARSRTTFIPYGSEAPDTIQDDSVLTRLGLKVGDYFLFVGRFIPDKGLHYLVPAFERLQTGKKLVLVGGSPNPSDYERTIRATEDSRILFPGYIYGADTINLIRNAYAYVQPSDVEGLSPVILLVMGLGTPLICSDIKENMFIVEETALTFRQKNIADLADKLNYALDNIDVLKCNSKAGRKRALQNFSWEKVVDQYDSLIRSLF